MKTSEKHTFTESEFELNQPYCNVVLANLRELGEANVQGKYEMLREFYAHARAGNEACQQTLAVIFYALDPRNTFGVSAKKVREIAQKIPMNTTGKTFGYSGMDVNATEIVEDLANRDLSGNSAISAIESAFKRLNGYGREVLRLILCKDLEIGVSVSTVNKAIPGFIFDFKVNLCKKFYEHCHKLKYPVWADPKLDGIRCNAEVRPIVGIATSTLRSREGNVFSGFEEIEQTLIFVAGLAMGTAIKHGFRQYQTTELVFEGELTEDTFYKVAGTIHKHEGGKKAIYKLFDIMPKTVFEGKEKLAFKDRREFLNALAVTLKENAIANCCVQVLDGKLLFDQEEVEKYYEEQRALGNEGAVVKTLNATYEGKRTDQWLKMKAEDQLDLRVVGYKQGEIGKKYEHTLGTLTVIYDGVEIEAAGFTEQWRKLIWDALQDPAEYDEVVGQIIEVEYHEKTPDGSLRHPRFKRFRSGKFATDVKRTADDEDPEFGVF